MFNDVRNGAGSVRTGLMMVMMMFFAALPLDIAVPALVLLGALALDWTAFQLFGGIREEGKTA